jgi:hypothetical protein
LFYPYYWARTAKWYGSALLDNPDPLFAEFPKAGSARMVVPLRPQLEGDVRYYLMTGQIWGGGAMPGITDRDYLPITEEIKARDDAPGTETQRPATTSRHVCMAEALKARCVLAKMRCFSLKR